MFIICRFIALLLATLVIGIPALATPPTLIDGGPAPEFAQIEQWHGSAPLTMAQLRGKVVLVDFWTYSCINCLRTLPHVAQWHAKYQARGLVVVGVHTPEFAFERSAANVRTAMARFGITYPVAQDNQYATWKAYGNQYWPAVYLIDRNGRIVLTHAGEGKYDEIDAAIDKLLGPAPLVSAKTMR
jgi:thiol-disulfide isomerase/thioredoxin